MIQAACNKKEAHLHDAGDPDDALQVVLLRKVAEDPIDQVERAVRAERRYVV